MLNVDYIRWMNWPTYAFEMSRFSGKIKEYLQQNGGPQYCFEVGFIGDMSGSTAVKVRKFLKDDVNDVLILQSEVFL